MQSFLYGVANVQHRKSDNPRSSGKNLEKYITADPADALFGISPEEAKIWHMARASLYQRALEMLCLG